MTIPIEAWHVLLVILGGAGWLYVNHLKPVSRWRGEKDLEIAKITTRLEQAEKELAKGDAAFDRLETLLRQHEAEARAQTAKIIERLASIETILKERSMVLQD